MVVFDAGILIKLLDNRTSDEERDKLEYLVTKLQKDKEKILIPTPALSEFHVKADPSVLDGFKGKSAFLITPFDEKSAIECAISVSEALGSGNKKGGQKEVPWAKVKFDHQIVAIAKANGADTIYSEDKGLRAFAKRQGLTAIAVAELPENPMSAQKKLDLVIEPEVKDKALADSPQARKHGSTKVQPHSDVTAGGSGPTAPNSL